MSWLGHVHDPARQCSKDARHTRRLELHCMYAAGFKKELGDVADESMLPDTETVGKT